MPILSRKDLERISRRVLFRYLTLSDRKMDRIDPVDFAEKICGLHFAFADMSVTGSILGLTSYSDVDLTISVPRGNGSVQEFHLNGNIAYVDQNLANAGSVGRLNFTLVHEAAHQILGIQPKQSASSSASIYQNSVSSVGLPRFTVTQHSLAICEFPASQLRNSLRFFAESTFCASIRQNLHKSRLRFHLF